jgi:hypothetical protein
MGLSSFRFVRLFVPVGVSLVGMAVAVGCQNADPSAVQAAESSSALTSSQQCLRQASNADLLAELQARLQASGSSSGSTGGGAVASYGCDSSTRLNVSVIAPDGTEKTAQVYVGNADSCNQTATLLNRTRHSISQTELIAICDSSTRLNRFSVTPDGTLQTLAQQYVGSADACIQQANQVNGG